MSLREDRMALSFAEGTLNQVAPGAIILVDDDRHTFALWYARYALGQRPDVTIVNANLLSYSWYQASLSEAQPGLTVARNIDDLIQQNIDQHPVYAVGNTLALPGRYDLATVEESQPLRRLSTKP
jgi:hypothetical protein